MRALSSPLVVLAAAGILGACTASPPAPQAALEGSAWVLSALPGHAPAGGRSVTLGFEGGRVQGSDGCNRYGAPVAVKGSSIAVSAQGISTRMACPPEVMAQADAFMAALNRARSYRIAGGKLELLAGDGALLATLAPQDRTLAGTAWRATGINNGKQAVVSVAGAAPVTLAFAAGGQASGSAGCNRYAARYQADGARLSFQPPAATRKMCPDERLMEQEQAFLRALETVAAARLEGDRLELRRADGALAVTLVRDGGE